VLLRLLVLTSGDLVEAAGRGLEAAAQIGDDLGGGADLIHPTEDLTRWHRDGVRVVRLVHPPVRFADQDVLQWHRQRFGCVGSLRGVGPLAYQQPGGFVV